MPNQYYKPLTGLRFVAAFMVFTHHFTPLWLPAGLYDVLQEWHVGVTVFFSLSGFLICIRYYDSFALEKSWFKKYMLNRIARIYPMYFILTTATLLVTHESFKIYLLNITFLRGFFQNFMHTGISQAWSLTVEETFYVCAPFIFFFSRKYFLWLQALVLLAIGILLTLYFNDINSWGGFFGSYRFTFLYTFFGRCLEFFMGIQLALWMKQGKSLKQFFIPYTYLGGAMILISTIGLATLRGNLKYGLFQNNGIVINNVVLPIFICLLIYGLIKENTLMSRFLSTSIMELLGKSSYCFYLIHLGIFHTFFRVTFGNYFLGELVFMMVLSAIFFKLIEEPLNKIIKRFSV